MDTVCTIAVVKGASVQRRKLHIATIGEFMRYAMHNGACIVEMVQYCYSMVVTQSLTATAFKDLLCDQQLKDPP